MSARGLVVVFAAALCAGCLSTEPDVPDTQSDIPDADPPSWVELEHTCPTDAPAVSLAAAARDSLGLGPQDQQGQWSQLARTVPGGFGGYFLENGNVVFYLVDLSKTADAVRGLAAAGLPIGPGAQARQGRWDFAQLYEWERYVLKRAAIEGLTFADVQEGRNRLEFGVVDEGARERFEQALRQLDIPCWLATTEIRAYAVAAQRVL